MYLVVRQRHSGIDLERFREEQSIWEPVVPGLPDIRGPGSNAPYHRQLPANNGFKSLSCLLARKKRQVWGSNPCTPGFAGRQEPDAKPSPIRPNCWGVPLLRSGTPRFFRPAFIELGHTVVQARGVGQPVLHDSTSCSVVVLRPNSDLP